jgi:staphylococcal nuclease domain-containing protein 1
MLNLIFVCIFILFSNVNEQLVLQGLATVIRHRLDEDRSQFYETYLAAELSAASSSKGVHNKKEVIVQRITDLTSKPSKKEEHKETKENGSDHSKNKQLTSKAKQYLVFLQREKQIPAVVEHVFTGGKVKLFVPKEHILVAFSLAGIRVPAAKAKDGSIDEIGTAAYEWVRSRLLQHSVRVEVETIDKGDNYLGSLFYGKVVSQTRRYIYEC